MWVIKQGNLFWVEREERWTENIEKATKYNLALNCQEVMAVLQKNKEHPYHTAYALIEAVEVSQGEPTMEAPDFEQMLEELCGLAKKWKLYRDVDGFDYYSTCWKHVPKHIRDWYENSNFAKLEKKRIEALAKLTQEEKELLGLQD